MRCYNGCPDDELQAVIDAKRAAFDEAKRLGINITYFPMEGQYMAFRDIEQVSGFHDHPRGALEEAKEKSHDQADTRTAC